MSPFKVITGIFSGTVSCLCVLSYADEQVVSLKNKQEEFALARTTLQHAADLAVKTKDQPIGRDGILRWIGVSETSTEDVPGVFKTAKKIQDPSDRVLALADIAFAQTQPGQPQEAVKTFRRAQMLVTSIKGLHDQAITLGKIGELQAKSQNHAYAAHTFIQAIQAANTLPPDNETAGTSFYRGACQKEVV